MSAGREPAASVRTCRDCGADEPAAQDAAVDSDDDGTPQEWALKEIAHLVRHEYRLKDHDPCFVLNTIGQVLDAYDEECAK